MKRVCAMMLLAALVATCGAQAAEPATTTAQRRPNVVVFLVDDLGLHDLGYTGSKFYESPNADALASRGCVFTNAYAACCVCSPTRAAMLTGKYPQRLGITEWIGGPQPEQAKRLPRYKDRLLPAPYKEQLALEETTLAEALKDAGYATFFAGKWHLGREPFYPDKQGFEVTFGASWRGSPGKDGYFSPYNVPLAPGPKGEHLDLRLATEAARWIGQQPRDKPFLVYFALYDVHVPLMAPQQTVEYFEQKRKRLGLTDEFGKEGDSKLRLNQSHAVYAAMIKTMDEAIGIVMKQLESQGLLDDTIIVFTSDNGGVSTAEGWPTSNAPLRAGKGWGYEGGVREPMLIIAPGVTRAGSHADDPAISMDFFPTLLDLCGLPLRPKDHLDGISLVPALRGEKLAQRPLFWHYPHYGNQGGEPYSAIRDRDWKLIVFHDPRHAPELYNLAVDPSEAHNLVAQEPQKVEQLRAKLQRWKKDVGAVDASPL